MTPDKSAMFRKEALDKLSSPDRLDQLMPVTSPLGWLALWTLAALLAGVLAWSLLGTIPRKVTGQGIMLRDSAFGIMDVTASSFGDIVRVKKVEGDIVRAGDIVAEVDQEPLREQVAGLQESLRVAREQDGEQDKSENEQIEILREKLRSQEQLFSRGLVTRKTVLETKTQLYNVISQGYSRDQKILELEDRIRQSEIKLRRDAVVRSPHDGIVIEVVVDPGDTVREGSRVLSLESLTGEYEVVAFIPAGDGKKVRKNMVAQVAPSTVKAEEFGYMLGRVREVSTFPVTPEAMKKLLRNDKLVETLAAQGPAIEMIVVLERDPSTVSEFRWTSPGGPPYEVEGGTIGQVSVVAERMRPITLLLPYLKKQLGFY